MRGCGTSMNENTNHENIININIITAKLSEFYDEFSEFHDYCAFLCDSFSCLASKSEPVENSTADGIVLFTDWMKYRIQLLKIELNDIQKQLHKFATASEK